MAGITQKVDAQFAPKSTVRWANGKARTSCQAHDRRAFLHLAEVEAWPLASGLSPVPITAEDW